MTPPLKEPYKINGESNVAAEIRRQTVVYPALVSELLRTRTIKKDDPTYLHFEGCKREFEYNFDSIPLNYDLHHSVMTVPEQSGWPKSTITLKLSKESFITFWESGDFVGLLEPSIKLEIGVDITPILLAARFQLRQILLGP